MKARTSFITALVIAAFASIVFAQTSGMSFRSSGVGGTPFNIDTFLNEMTLPNAGTLSFYPNSGTGRVTAVRVDTVGTITDAVQLGGNAALGVVLSVNAGSGFTLSSTRAVRFNTYGAGTITADASGNLTSVSDESVKDIQGPYTAGCAEIARLKPIEFTYRANSGYETAHTYAGFSAQNARAAVPLSTGQNADGKLTLQDRALIAALVNCVGEQRIEIEALQRRRR